MRSTVLFRSSMLTVLDVSCDPGPQPVSGVEVEPAHALSLPLAGVYVHHTPQGTLVVDPTVAVFRNAGDEHRTAHPTTAGDRNIELQLPAHVAEPLLDAAGKFRTRSTYLPDRIALRHRRFLRGLRQPLRTSTLAIEDEAMVLLAEVQRLAEPPGPSPRHRRAVDQARQYLAARFLEDPDLPSIAAAVGMSPFHLSRVFKRATGRSLTDYRTALRLRFALDRIASGADDLSRVAVDAGFYDHAHMTNTVRRRLGSTPSHIRSSLTP